MRSGSTIGGDGLGPLFEGLRDPARKDGPDTSKESARKLKKSGRLAEQSLETLAALREHVRNWGSSPTNQELAKGDPALVHIYSRRLADLARVGLIRKTGARTCMITGRRAATWEPCEE